MKAILLFCLTTFSFANGIAEREKIEILINKIENSNFTFIRNNKNHTAKEAARHLRMKLKNAQESWFAPKKSQWSARMFIERIASKSSFTGNKYVIKLKSNETIYSKDWLFQSLAHIEEENKIVDNSSNSI